MFNNNYGLEQAKKLGQSVERVRNDDIDVYIAKKNPKYIETSNDRPNFYAKFLYNKAKAENPNLTKEEYIDNVISAYEKGLEFTKLPNDNIISSYLVNNDYLTLSLKPYKVADTLGIEVKDLFSLNYIKIYLKETNEIKYLWIDSISNNDSRRESITLVCSIDRWLTYYKQVILNMHGDVRVLRKHENRFVERNGRLVGNYSSDSNIHNIDPQFANMTTGTIRSLGLIDAQSLGGTTEITNIKLNDNRILFEFYIDGKLQDAYVSNSYVETTPGDNNKTFVKGTGNILYWSAYDKNGDINKYKDDSVNKEKILPTTYSNSTMITINKEKDTFISYSATGWGSGVDTSNTNIDTKEYVAYAPKFIGKVSFADYDYIYVVRYDTQDNKKDAYGIIVSKTQLDDDPNWSPKIINRIDNVKNSLFINNTISKQKTIRDVEPNWRILVSTPIENLSNNINPINTKLVKQDYDNSFGNQHKIYNYVSQPNEDLLKVYLVDYNTKQGYGRYGTMIEIPSAKVSFNVSIVNTPFSWKDTSGFYTSIEVTNPNGAIDLVVNDNKGVDNKYSAGVLNKNSIGVVFNGTINNNKCYSIGNWDNIGVELQASIDEKGLDEVEGGLKSIVDYPITDWNKTSTLDVSMVNEITQPEWVGLLEPLKMRFAPVVYEKDADWKYDREPQLKMGHCIKHFLDYLGVKKQLFLEFGNVDSIKLNQTILPNACIDKIYYTDSENDYNAWELVNTNGFLTKTYDNSIPMISDAFTSFIASNKASLQNSYLVAEKGLDFAKQQASLNTQMTNIGGASSIFNGVMSGVNSMLLGGAFANTSYANGFNLYASALDKKGGSISNLNQHELDTLSYNSLFNDITTGIGAAGVGLGAVKSIGNGIIAGLQTGVMKQQTELNNQRMIFNAQSQINGINAMVKDKYNQPDQLNAGSIEVNGIIRYQQELSKLFEQYGSTSEKVNFKIDTQAPTKTKLKEYSQFLHQYGYASGNLYLKQDIDTLLSRTRFNFIQLGDIQNMFLDVKLENANKNYFMNIFNQGVRLWNVGYENQEMLDYSKENWEIELEEKN